MTQEWIVNEEFFPFVCKNCEKEFEDHEIIRSARSYGYVNLTNGEFTFIGLSCLSCNHITLKKFRSSNIKPAINELFSAQQAFIAFIPDESIDLYSKECTDWFIVPDEIPQLKYKDYPIDLIDQFSSKWPYNRFLYRIVQNDLTSIIDWENANHRKILPRIISSISPYYKTEYLLSYLEYPESKSNNPIRVKDIFGFLFFLARDKYLNAEETTITEDEYRNLTVHYVANSNYIYPVNLKNICDDMLRKYFQKRNNFDFEQSWKKDFIDEYILKLFYREGYYLSDQYYQNKQEFEKIFGKVFRNSQPKIDESQASEVMTCQQVVAQIGVEPIKLINYIANGDLPAYYGNRVYYDPHENESHNELMDPEKFLYLSSEVEELLWRRPELKQSAPSIPNEKELSPEDKDAVDYARILFEEAKFDASLEAAINVGCKCAKEKIVFAGDELISFLDKIIPGIPVSSIRLIWEALPTECKNGNELPQSLKLSKRENEEYKDYYPDKFESKIHQKLKTRETTVEKKERAIKAALMVAYNLKIKGKRTKREDIANMIDCQFGDITSDASKRIIRLLPSDIKYGPGNPRKKQDQND